MKISDILAAEGRRRGHDRRPDATVRELVAALAEHRIGAVVVTDGADIVGIVSERDVVRTLNERGTDARRRRGPRTDDRRGRHLHALTTTSTSIAETMTERRIRHMPVIANGQLVGVVSIGDVVKSRIGDLEQERGHLEHYISQ